MCVHVRAVSEGSLSIEQLRCLPDLRRFENSDIALAHAIQTLETLPTFTAVRRFQLGMRNDLREWIQAGFRQIVLSIPIESLTGQDVDAIGIQGYWAITRAKSALQEHHLLLAY